jgi:hypothetical protein
MTLRDQLEAIEQEKLQKRWGDERLEQIATHIKEGKTRSVILRFPNEYFNSGRYGTTSEAMRAISQDLDRLGNTLPDNLTYSAKYSAGHTGLDAKITLDIYQKPPRRRRWF